MPSLQVAIDPENRTGSDAARVADNIGRVGTAGENLSRQLQAPEKSIASLGVAGAATALSLLDITRSVSRFRDGTATLNDFAFAGTQAIQAVTLLNRAFGLSAFGSVGIVVGTAAASYALLSLRTGEAAREQDHLRSAIENANQGIIQANRGLATAQAGLSVGDRDATLAGIQQQRDAIFGLIELLNVEGSKSFEIGLPGAGILGILDAIPTDGNKAIVTIEQLIERFKELDRSLDPRTPFSELTDSLELQLRNINESPEVQAAWQAIFQLEGQGPLSQEQVNEILDRYEQLGEGVKLKQLSDDMSRAFVDPIVAGIQAGHDFEEVVGDIGLAVQAAFLQNVIAQPIANALSSQFFNIFGGAGLFGAHGLAMSGGSVVGLAHGGLLTQPTVMSYGNQTVVAREAGRDEFVMPAQRVGQDLGVKAVADPGTRAAMDQMSGYLRRLVTIAEGGAGNSFGYSSRQMGRR